MSSWWLVELWRALLWWSHISHAMFHNFLISSAIHCLLDLHWHHCSQYASCVAHQSKLSQPSRATSHPISSCFCTNSEVFVCGLLLHQACNSMISSSVNCGSNCSACIHSLRCFRVSFHFFVAALCRHWMIWGLSSFSWPHHGHWSINHWCHLTMFLLWAKWPDICFDAHGICLVEHFAPHDPVIASQYFGDGEVGGCTILASMWWHLGHWSACIRSGPIVRLCKVCWHSSLKDSPGVWNRLGWHVGWLPWSWPDCLLPHSAMPPWKGPLDVHCLGIHRWN